MLRQNRYHIEDFIVSPQELKLNGDEILISEKHDIVIALEAEHVEKFHDLKDIFIEISKNIPAFDNLTQDIYESMTNDTDFAADLAVVYFADNEVLLDYWSEGVNNQFDITFCRHGVNWELRYWNGIDIRARYGIVLVS